MKLFVFGSSITSTYWNGACTYYRGIYKNLHRLGYQITFAEPDIYQRQQNRDREELDYVTVRIYQTPQELDRVLSEASDADLIIKHSGVGADDELLESAVLECRADETQAAFWDVDAPATLARVEANPRDHFYRLIPRYDFVFTYGGARPVLDRYLRLGARNCYPIYNALDPDTHHPVIPNSSQKCDLAFVGHRLPDREQRVEDFFFAAAERAPEFSFVLGGEGWGGKSLPNNVRWIGHVGSADHNRINCSARMVMNITRDSMAQVGFSPPTRVFEAAGAGACLITDAWPGVEDFFAPSQEILVASSASEVVRYLRQTSHREAARIGAAMRKRALAEHTYRLRAFELHRILVGRADRTELISAPSAIATRRSVKERYD
jgi:spore maturation protein CgeB